MMAETFPVWWLAGLLWALAIGWAASSYISTFIYRIPRGEKIFVSSPYCDNCDARLHSADLAPILSYIFTGGKCRYCGARVPLSYLLVELLYPLLMAVLYIKYGFTDIMFILAVLGFMLLVQAVIAFHESFFSKELILWMAFMGTLMKTMVTGSVLNAVLSGFMGGVIGCIIMLLCNIGRFSFSAENILSSIKPYVWLFAIAGLWLPLNSVLLFALLWVIGFVLVKLLLRLKDNYAAYTISYDVALFASVLYGY